MPAYEMLPSDKRQPGGRWSGRAFLCGLRRPAAELRAVAALIEHGHVFRAWVADAVLYVGGNSDELTEGLARLHVELARTVLAEALDAAPDLLALPGPVPLPIVAGAWDNPLRREYTCYSSKPFAVGYRASDYVMPYPWSGRAALVSGPDDGVVRVHLLHRDTSKEDHNDDLGTALFTILAKREVVRGNYPDTFSLDFRGLTRMEVSAVATVAMNLAHDAILAFAEHLETLPVSGRPSIFAVDDNDARDTVLEALAAGGAIEVVDGGDHVDDRYLLDGIEVPAHVFDRLGRADWLQGDGGRRDPSRLYRLSPHAKVRPRDVAPRDHSVSFASFSERCRFRRWDCHHECANHDKYDEDRCDAHGCPLTTPVYSKEVDNFGDDPFFGWDHERDVEVTADHPGTERSYAWRAAGAQRVDAIVSTVIDAYARYRAGYLCSDAERKAAREAIALGHLVLTDDIGVGLMVALTDDLKARVEQSQAKAA